MKLLTLILLLTTSTAQAFNVESLFVAQEQTKTIIKNFPSWDKSSKKRISTYSPVIIDIANKLNVDSKILLSVAWAESHFRPKLKSWVGAKGIMQVKDVTLNETYDKFADGKLFTQIITKHNNIRPKIIENLIGGALYIKYLLNKYNDTQKAMIAYNVGPTGLYRLMKKENNLDKHRYFIKISKNMRIIASL